MFMSMDRQTRMLLIDLLFHFYLVTPESCAPQQSIQNDCTIFTGLLSVYGLGVTTHTFNTILQIFHDEFPSFRLRTDSNTNKYDNQTVDGLTTGSDEDDAIVIQLIQYGIIRLNLSDTSTQIISNPSDPKFDHDRGWEITVRTIVAFLLMILCIAVGIYIIGRYINMKLQINRGEDRFDMDGKKLNHASKSNQWTIFRRKDGTDITETSSTSSSSSVSTWDNRKGNVDVLRNVRALCNPIRRHPQLRRPRTPMELTVPGRAVPMMHTDSIYIVESEEEEEEDDDDVGNANASIQMNVYTGSLVGNERFYTSVTSLWSDDTERYNYIENDPLYTASSAHIS
jgi:hypothetical protein